MCIHKIHRKQSKQFPHTSKQKLQVNKKRKFKKKIATSYYKELISLYIMSSKNWDEEEPNRKICRDEKDWFCRERTQHLWTCKTDVKTLLKV